ncbi:MAG TPA: amidohydrolase family protein, partial [candidate division Zixibacteria bacterium]|nr:amidohydrolase family protein [candidate division Zixibacteria bacterium]
APGNAARLAQEKIPFAFTAAGLDDPSEYLSRVRTAVRYGLPPETALRALTTVPARLCGVDRYVGTLEPGKLANLVVCSGDLFADTTRILAVWAAGQKYEFEPLHPGEYRGQWQLRTAADSATLALEGAPSKLAGRLVAGSDSVELGEIEAARDRITFRADSLWGKPGVCRFSGRLFGDSLRGFVAFPDGRRSEWQAVRTAPLAAEKDTAGAPSPAPEPEPFVSRLTYPNRAYGLESVPVPQDVLVRNATIWTSDEAGVLEGADMLVRGGKIAALGRNLESPSGAAVIDAAGKHVSPGIIDEHSHIAIDGDVNEGTHAVTSEVRIADILDPDDLNIYRELAGGVTASRLLHGSANPIGGQAATIKLRWGLPADSLVFAAAPKAIKFALGENVKQSGWGERFTIRYPQTRLGVDAIIRDAFLAAQAYEQRWDRFRRLGKSEQERTIPPRRDLQLEPLADVLHRRMAIHCHGYVAPEMLMMIRLAQEFDLELQSFAHGLEGYKIARELADAGVGVGSIPDWWAYKFETYDGIPHSPALMSEKGVVVAINSDSPELARHLNQEAAKSVMYGGMKPEEALKMVTINPARLLGVDDLTGSLRVGKDADFVIWSDNPLSIYARAEQTWVDGRKFFDLATDSLLREQLQTEKQRLIQKVLRASGGGSPKRPPRGRPGPPPDGGLSSTEGGAREAHR